MKPLARAAASMRRSGIREIMDLAAGQPDVLHLEVGEPDFPTPPHIVEAGVAAARAGFTRYAPNAGLPELREAIAEKLARVNGLRVTPEQVVVTAGSVCGLMTTLMALVEPGDEVLLPDPGWPNCEMMVRAIGARPVPYPLDPVRGFLPDLNALVGCITARTKALLVNTPANPTGAVFPEETIRRLVAIAVEHDLYLVSDEVYDQLVYDGEHFSPGRLDGDGRVVSIYSFSKTYSMTGWRVGYVAAAPDIAEVVTKLQEPVVSCASTVSQKAAEAALLGAQECVDEMRLAYRERRDTALSILREDGVDAVEPHGAFYLLVDIGRATSDTYTFARDLLREQRVAVAPGEAFGLGGRGFVRLSLAADRQVVAEGTRRLAARVAEASRSPA
jgi:aspartate/methionine/tyrosine aminotransferase